MKIGEVEKHIKNQLQIIYDGQEASAIAAMVMEQITSFSIAERIVEKEKILPQEQLFLVDQYLQRLLQHEPVQYILGSAHFYGMNLFVDGSVLIPRPETEELVDWIVKDVKASGKNVFENNDLQSDETTQLKILDMGTGSGCIALALKQAIPKAEVWGCDVSDEALNIARRNGSALNIRVDFQGVNFLEEAQQKSLPTVDIIVSNPPYIPNSEQEKMKPNVLQYEPHQALFVPEEDVLIFYKAICQFSKKRLYENGSIYLEIHEDQGQQVIDLFRMEGYTSVELKKDMQGKDRMVKVQK